MLHFFLNCVFLCIFCKLAYYQWFFLRMCIKHAFLKCVYFLCIFSNNCIFRVFFSIDVFFVQWFKKRFTPRVHPASENHGFDQVRRAVQRWSQYGAPGNAQILEGGYRQHGEGSKAADRKKEEILAKDSQCWRWYWLHQREECPVQQEAGTVLRGTHRRDQTEPRTGDSYLRFLY